MTEETEVEVPSNNEAHDYFTSLAASTLSRSSRSRNAFRNKKSASLPSCLKYSSSPSLAVSHTTSPTTSDYEEIPLHLDRNPRFQYAEALTRKRSFIRRSSKRKITRPASTSSFSSKHSPLFPSLPYLPSLENISSLTKELKHFVPERNGSIRRSLRSTVSSFKHFGRQKPTTVAGFVIQDRYLNSATWAELASLDPRTMKEKLKSENKVFEKCPRIIREGDVVQGSWKDLRSLGLFLRPYQPFLAKEQFTVQLNFRSQTYKLSHELYEGVCHVVLCDVRLVMDVSHLVLGEPVAVPNLTLCQHDPCALSAIEHAICQLQGAYKCSGGVGWATHCLSLIFYSEIMGW